MFRDAPRTRVNLKVNYKTSFTYTAPMYEKSGLLHLDPWLIVANNCRL
jgi:hypothetical protein